MRRSSLGTGRWQRADAAAEDAQLNFNEGVAPAVIGVIDAAGRSRDVTIRAVANPC